MHQVTSTMETADLCFPLLSCRPSFLGFFGVLDPSEINETRFARSAKRGNELLGISVTGPKLLLLSTLNKSVLSSDKEDTFIS